jgi:hypothetical protein
LDVLVCHDGELGDVCGLLRELGCDFVERAGPALLSERTRPWGLVIATPTRALRLGIALGQPETRSIVVADPGTRTAVRRLQQLGVEWIVRRPVHRAALRLLVQLALYRGPERRRAQRVSVGLPVRYRAGWLPRRAILRELSLRGASLIAPQRVEPGRRISLHLAAEGPALAFRGEVVRARAVGAGETELAIAFDAQPASSLLELRRLVDRYARGPAVCATAGAARTGRAAQPAPPPAAASAGERRESERRGYARRLIALGDDAPRVLIGRDLSLGGLCVEPGVPLVAGQRLRLALYGRAGEVPLVVDAQVVRVEPAGAGLRFEGLSEAHRGYLAKMIDALPGVSTPSAARGEERRVLAELVEETSTGGSPS